jgi:hypothetical protein
VSDEHVAEPPAAITDVLRDGEKLLLWSPCCLEQDPGTFALTSDRLLFVNDRPLGISLAQRIAQGRTMRMRDGVLELSTPEREASFTGLSPDVIKEVVGTLGKHVKIGDRVVAARVKQNRKQVRKRVLHTMTIVPKTVVARDLSALPPSE